MFPETIEQISGALISIIWNDGKKCLYSAKSLRANCPCAVCKEERSQEGPLKILKVYPKSLEILDWKWVGRYALSLSWSDGHDTGIYTFDYLRNFCEEEE